MVIQGGIRSRPRGSIALLLGSVGMAAYMASNVTSRCGPSPVPNRSSAARGRLALLGVGEALLAVVKGTAFDIY